MNPTVVMTGRSNGCRYNVILMFCRTPRRCRRFQWLFGDDCAPAAVAPFILLFIVIVFNVIVVSVFYHHNIIINYLLIITIKSFVYYTPLQYNV